MAQRESVPGVKRWSCHSAILSPERTGEITGCRAGSSTLTRCSTSRAPLGFVLRILAYLDARQVASIKRLASATRPGPYMEDRMKDGVRPAQPKIYHIVHVDRLPSIIKDGNLWCDAVMAGRMNAGTAIGMTTIKQRRSHLGLSSHPGLHVGDCVPFYFCPRSVMLYVIHRKNHPELGYRGGQELVVHLEADVHDVVGWCRDSNRRWAFTSSNAGSFYCEDFCDLAELDAIDWRAVEANDWQRSKEGKQAEFLVESSFPWGLVDRIGVAGPSVGARVHSALQDANHRPRVQVMPHWYY